MPKRSVIAIALALALGAAAPGAGAFGFGEPEILTTLGEPLHMRVPLQTDPDVDLSSQCLHLLGSAQDPLPTLTAARLYVEERGKERILHIDSFNPVNEPILRVIVDAGCVRHVQREFAVLLDPPAPAVAPAGPALAPAATTAAAAATLSPEGSTNVVPASATIAAEVGPIVALDLGVARVQGRMGEPLIVQIPITGTEATKVEDASVRVARVLTGDGTPLRNPAQVSLTRTDTSATLLLMTPGPIDEPAVRIEVEVATAAASVRREYGVLLELPAAATPVKSAEVEAPAPETLAPAPAQPPAPAPTAEANPPPAPAVETPSTSASAAPPPPPAEEAPKPRKHPHTAPKAPTTIPTAPSNSVASPNAPVAAPTAKGAESAAAKSAEAAAKPGAGDHLVLTPAPDEKEKEDAAKRFAEMDQRVKDLTQEIVKLRTELATQKQKETDLLAQQGPSSGNWIIAIAAAVAAAIAALLLIARRRGGAQSWNPASWDQVTRSYAESDPAMGPAARAQPVFTGERAAKPARGETERAAKPAAPVEARAASRPAPQGNTTVNDPITVSALTTPIEVTEVQGNEASIDQLYTLFYDIGGNTTPGGPVPPRIGPSPTAALPGGGAPARDSLDIDLGIPDSVESGRAARAQGAMKPSTAASAKADAPKPPSFTYDEKAASAEPAVPPLDQPTTLGPPTEIPRDSEFAKTVPSLDLDLTTNIATASQFGPVTEMPRDEEPLAATPAAAPAVKPAIPAPPPLPTPPAPATAAVPPGGAPAELELDLSTNIGSVTQVGPQTVIPLEDEDPKTRVELDLDLNTNANIAPVEDNDRESDPFAIPGIQRKPNKGTGA